jgi:hypothetical protein
MIGIPARATWSMSFSSPAGGRVILRGEGEEVLGRKRNTYLLRLTSCFPRASTRMHTVLKTAFLNLLPLL